MLLPNTTVTTQDWLNGNHTVKVNAYLGGATVTYSPPPIQVPFKVILVPEQQAPDFTRAVFFNALARAADPWERQMVHDVESGAIDKLLRDLDAEEDGELEEL